MLDCRCRAESMAIARAAVDIGGDRFNPNQLGQTSVRNDEIGHLPAPFKKLILEIHLREQRLRHEVQEFCVEIDEAKRSQQVKEIVDTDFLRDLKNLAIKAKALRQRDR